MTCRIYRSLLKLRKDNIDVRDISLDKKEERKGEQRQQPQRWITMPLLYKLKTQPRLPSLRGNEGIEKEIYIQIRLAM